MNVGIDIRRYGEFAFKIYDLLSCYFCGKTGAYLFKFTISYINVLQAVLALVNNMLFIIKSPLQT